MRAVRYMDNSRQIESTSNSSIDRKDFLCRIMLDRGAFVSRRILLMTASGNSHHDACPELGSDADGGDPSSATRSGSKGTA